MPIFYFREIFKLFQNQHEKIQAAQNQNIIRKWSLSILKIMELMKPELSLKKKRFVISLCPIQYLEEVLSF